MVRTAITHLLTSGVQAFFWLSSGFLFCFLFQPSVYRFACPAPAGVPPQNVHIHILQIRVPMYAGRLPRPRPSFRIAFAPASLPSGLTPALLPKHMSTSHPGNYVGSPLPWKGRRSAHREGERGGGFAEPLLAVLKRIPHPPSMPFALTLGRVSHCSLSQGTLAVVVQGPHRSQGSRGGKQSVISVCTMFVTLIVPAAPLDLSTSISFPRTAASVHPRLQPHLPSKKSKISFWLD
jgi:hypothetical protein